ncbi:MAG: cytochrome c3 family protein [candidate division NC10 bacterium]|nr:cytochrome c3 family protein [candidate division NC10 bacterium]
MEMEATRGLLSALGGALLLLLVAGGAEALPKCLICHGKPTLSKTLPSGRVISLFVDERQLKESVHAGRTCTDCHSDITAIPHKGEIKRVSCIRCHFKGNPVGAPQKDIYVEYAKSVHGVAAAAGNTKAPVCQDCHGNHTIRPPKDPRSQMNKAHIPETCGRCHLPVFSDYRESAHWKAFVGGKTDSAVCTDCHGEHTIRPHESPESPTYITHVPETCSRCHASVAVVGKYGIKTEQVATYGRSFHGIAIKYGGKTVANCASCHGVHDIRPSDDPKSAVHVENIPKTCGKCHTGANVNYAKGKIHVDPTKKEAGPVYWVSLFFKWLTISVMVGLIGHISLDLFRRFRRRGSAH